MAVVLPCRVPFLGNAVHPVFGVGAKLQMGRVATDRVVALVHNNLIYWYFTIFKLINDAVRSASLPCPVPGRIWPRLPRPARLCAFAHVDVVKEFVYLIVSQGQRPHLEFAVMFLAWRT